MDPQQEFFTAVRAACMGACENVHDTFLPPPTAAYPFVYIRGTSQDDTRNKSCITGSVQINLDVWHNKPRRRGIVSEIMRKIKLACYAIEHTSNYNWSVRSISAQGPIADNSPGNVVPLVRGMITINADFTPKG